MELFCAAIIIIIIKFTKFLRIVKQTERKSLKTDYVNLGLNNFFLLFFLDCLELKSHLKVI